MYTDIPALIQQQNNHLVANRFKKRPIPVHPMTSNPIKGDKTPHLMTFRAATELLDQHIHDCLVFFYTLTCPVLVIDMDHCIHNGQLLPPFAAILNAHPTYVEISNSGHGLHAYYRCATGEKHGMPRKSVYYLDDRDQATKAEAIIANHLCCITGNTYGDTDQIGVSPVGSLFNTLEQQLPHRPRTQAPAPVQANPVPASTPAHPFCRMGSSAPAPAHSDPSAFGEVSAASVREALSYLEPDMPYDDWISTGMAIHSQWPDNTGRQLFEDWSRQGETFRQSDFNTSWQSFTHNGGITIATLFHNARRYGYKPERNLSPVPTPKPKPKQTTPDLYTDKPDVHADTEPSLKPPITFLSMQQLLQIAQPQWLVEKLIPEKSIGQLFGATQTFKSFLALHLSLSMSHGIDFLGQSTANGQVLYMCGERIEDFAKRCLGWSSHYGISIENSPDIMFTHGCYDIASPSHTAQFLAYLDHMRQHNGFKPALIVVDTLSKSFYGCENNTEDMGHFLKALDTIRNRTGASILLIHHTGHSDSTRARGSSRLPDDLDFCLRCVRDTQDDSDNYATRLVVIKQKDTEIIPDIPVILHQVDTPRGNTLVPDLFSLDSGSAPVTVTERQQNQIAVLRGLLADHEKRLEGRGTARVTAKDFRNACMDAGLSKYEGWSGELKRLVSTGVIERDGPYVAFCYKKDGGFSE